MSATRRIATTLTAICSVAALLLSIAWVPDRGHNSERRAPTIAADAADGHSVADPQLVGALPTPSAAPAVATVVDLPRLRGVATCDDCIALLALAPKTSPPSSC